MKVDELKRVVREQQKREEAMGEAMKSNQDELVKAVKLMQKELEASAAKNSELSECCRKYTEEIADLKANQVRFAVEGHHPCMARYTHLCSTSRGRSSSLH